jgi:hypothetical protein
MITNPNEVPLDPQHAAVLASLARQTGKSYQELVASAIDVAFAKEEPSAVGQIGPDEQRQNLHALLERMSRLPVCHPQDGLSGRDHDEILYGRNQL